MKRHVSSGTWAGITPKSRADLYRSSGDVKAHLERLYTCLASLGIDVTGPSEKAIRMIFADFAYTAYLAGTELESSFRSATELEHEMRIRLEVILLENGIVPPSRRKLDPGR